MGCHMPYHAEEGMVKKSHYIKSKPAFSNTNDVSQRIAVLLPVTMENGSQCEYQNLFR